MYGAGQNKKSLIADLENSINKNHKTFKMSKGNQYRDFMPVEKVVEQLYILFKNKQSGVYNICSGYPIKLKDLVKKILIKKIKKLNLI